MFPNSKNVKSFSSYLIIKFFCMYVFACWQRVLVRRTFGSVGVRWRLSAHRPRHVSRQQLRRHQSSPRNFQRLIHTLSRIGGKVSGCRSENLRDTTLKFIHFLCVETGVRTCLLFSDRPLSRTANGKCSIVTRWTVLVWVCVFCCVKFCFLWVFTWN